MDYFWSVFVIFTIENLRFTKNALTQSIFELEKCLFLKLVRISPEIHSFHFQCASMTPTWKSRPEKLIKTPMS